MKDSAQFRSNEPFFVHDFCWDDTSAISAEHEVATGRCDAMQKHREMCEILCRFSFHRKRNKKICQTGSEQNKKAHNERRVRSRKIAPLHNLQSNGAKQEMRTHSQVRVFHCNTKRQHQHNNRIGCRIDCGGEIVI